MLLAGPAVAGGGALDGPRVRDGTDAELPAAGGVARLTPVVDAVMPMSELARAHELMEGNTTFGKIVMVW